MEEDPVSRPEFARPEFERQLQYGRRVIFSWSPIKALGHELPTAPWPLASEVIEGVECASEQAAHRFVLPEATGLVRMQVGEDTASWGPYFAFRTWEAAERWLYDQPGGERPEP